MSPTAATTPETDIKTSVKPKIVEADATTTVPANGRDGTPAPSVPVSPVDKKPATSTPADNKATPAANADDGNINDAGIDEEIFSQILDLDDEEDDDPMEFSRGMVEDYLKQAVETFDKMDKALDARNLKELSDLGHFLKGSSAALGVTKVQASCESIQHYGKLHDAKADKPITEDDATNRISEIMSRVRGEFALAKKWLNERYGGTLQA